MSGTILKFNDILENNEAYFQNMSYTCMVNVKECYGEKICMMSTL